MTASEPSAIRPHWPRSFTADGLSVLRVCRYQYQRRYVEGVPERIFSSLGRSPGELDRAQIGEIVHRCLELLDGTSREDLPRLVKKASDSLALPPPVSRQEAEIVEMLERFIRSSWWEMLGEAQCRQHEAPFVCRMSANGLVAAAQEGGIAEQCLPSDILIEGRVDCVFVTQAGEMMLLDYKTHDVDRDEIPVHLPQHEFQMQVYGYALRQAFAAGRWPPPAPKSDTQPHSGGAKTRESPPLRAAIWYLRPGQEQKIVPWAMEEVEKQILSLARTILWAQERDLPRRAKRDEVCLLCGYYPWACPGGGTTE